MFYKNLVEAIRPPRFIKGSANLNTGRVDSGRGRTSSKWPRMYFIAGVDCTWQYSEILQKREIYERLISYWKLRPESEDWLKRYIPIGLIYPENRKGVAKPKTKRIRLTKKSTRVKLKG